MKKLLLASLILVITGLGTTAKAQIFEEGAKIVQGGIGFGFAYGAAGTNAGLPPLHVSAEYGFNEKIGLGALLGFSTASQDFGGFGKYNYNFLVIGARGTYHFYQEGKIDAYGGAMLGYNIASVSYKGNSAFYENAVKNVSVGGVSFGGFAGARYSFNEQLHGFAEVGYNIAYFSFGVGYKL